MKLALRGRHSRTMAPKKKAAEPAEAGDAKSKGGKGKPNASGAAAKGGARPSQAEVLAKLGYSTQSVARKKTDEPEAAKDKEAPAKAIGAKDKAEKAPADKKAKGQPVKAAPPLPPEIARIANLLTPVELQRIDGEYARLAQPVLPDEIDGELRLEPKSEFLALAHLKRTWDFGTPQVGRFPDRDRDVDALARRINATAVYLVRQGFDEADVRAAMEATSDDDFAHLVEYLCMTLPDEKLPKEFADKFYENVKEHGSKSSITGIVVRSATPSSQGRSTPSIDQKPDPFTDAVESSAWDDGIPETSSTNGIAAPTPKPGVDDEIKSRILAADQSPESDSDEGADEAYLEIDESSPASLEQSLSNLVQLYNSFAYFDEFSDEDRETLRKVSKRIEKAKKIMKEMGLDIPKGEGWDLDKAVMGRLKRKTAAAAKQPSTNAPKPKPAPSNEDDEPSLDTLFNQSEDQPPKPASQQHAPKVSLSLPIPTSWTGKTPLQLIQQYAAKCKSRAVWEGRTVRFTGGAWDNKVLEIPKGISIEGGGRGNQDYLATLALFTLVPQLNLHRLLPPAHRELLEQWEEEKKGKGEEEKRKVEEERARWINRVLERRKEISASRGKQKAGKDNGTERVSEMLKDVSLEDREGFKDVSARIGQLKATLEKRLGSADYADYLKTRTQLPVFAMREQIVRTIRDNSVTIISGETGSGKSTQVPSFLLEDLIMNPPTVANPADPALPSIIVTQPRRISASSLSYRVSKEVADPSQPGYPGSWIGYSVRLEDRTNRDTMVTFMTTGILLRRLEQDPELKGVGCVVVDEVHERTADGDYLIRLLKELLPKRPALRVVLMSATINLAKLSAYFPLAPVISVSGRTFPVAVSYLEDVVQKTGYVLDPESEFAKRRDRVRRDLGRVDVKGKGGSSKTVRLEWEEEDEEDDDDEEPDAALYSKDTRSVIRRLNKEIINYDLVENLVRHICETEPQCGGADGGGAIVIFMPGLQEIRRCHVRLSTLPMLARDPDAFWLIPLHSALTGTSQDQDLAFRIPPRGVRKIVIATNIAETGITIPDCSHVIDSGKVKEVRYDDRRQLTQLKEVWISRASAEQRKGRAGRVREGTCWRLFTKARYEKMYEFPVPELLRSTLDEIILRCKLAGVSDVSQFLSEMLDPPQPAVVQRTIDKLRLCQALSINGELTPLGYHLAHLPVDVHLGRMLLTGALLQCLDPILTICASLSLGKSPFLRPFGKEAEADRARLPFKVGHSDLLTLANVHRKWREMSFQPGTKTSAVREWCRRNYLSEQNLLLIEETRWQLYRYIAGVGFADSRELRALEVASGGKGRKSGSYEDQFCILPNSLDKRSGLNAVVNAAIVSGLYPNVMTRDRNNKDYLVEAGSKGQQAVHVHPSSVFSFDKIPPGKWWYASHAKVKSTRVYAWDVNLVGTSSVIGLFGGALEVLAAKKVLTIDDTIKLKCAPKTGFVFSRLRQEVVGWLIVNRWVIWKG